ncbi:MAG: hypothetical protein CM1200mP29_16350 [Verrucomicrobiota bacterium]|nr:MAG: hypothetical protein CM1200mP29_16350 [Verrucomicrobiota bacterium]
MKRLAKPAEGEAKPKADGLFLLQGRARAQRKRRRSTCRRSRMLLGPKGREPSCSYRKFR